MVGPPSRFSAGMALLFYPEDLMRKLLVLLVSCCAMLAASCGPKQQGLTFAVGGTPNELDYWETVAQNFTAETGIAVKLLQQPTDTDQRRQGLVLSLRSGNNAPDLFLMDVGWISQFAHSNWLEPLDDQPAQKTFSVAENFFPNIVHSVDLYRNRLIALPVYVDGGILYYRKDLLAKYGAKVPPETWDELVSLSKRAKNDQKRGFYGFVWQGAQYEGLICNFIEFAGSAGGGVGIKDGHFYANTPQNLKALKFMHSLIKSEVSPPNTFTEMREEEVRNLFQRGNVLFERNWPYAWALHNDSASPVHGKVAIAPLPHFTGGRSVATLGGWHVAMAATSKRKAEALKFMEYILSYEVQKSLALRLGWNPGRMDVYGDPEIRAKLPHFAKLRDLFENAIARPNLPYYTLISEVMQRHISAALSGQEKPELALQLIEEEADKIVRQYEKP